MKNVMKAMLISLVVMPFFAHAAPVNITNETPWKLVVMVGNNKTKQVMMPNDILTLSEKRVAADCENMEHRCNMQVIANTLSYDKSNNLIGTMVFDVDKGLVAVLNPNQDKLVSFSSDNGFNIKIKNYI